MNSLTLYVKLKKFEIENVRSVKNTDCLITGNITLLAGKNESGKSNILYALQSLNTDFEFEQDNDLPVDVENEELNVTYHFELDDDEKKIILEKHEIKNKDYQNLPNNITIKTSNNGYEISGTAFDKIFEYVLESKSQTLSELQNMVSEINSQIPENISKISKPDFISNESIERVIEEVDQIISQIPLPKPTEQNPNPAKPAILNSLNSLKNFANALSIDEIKDDVSVSIWEIRPKVVLFSSIKDTLPAEIPNNVFTSKDTLKQEHPIVYDLVNLAQLDVEKLQTENRQKRHNLIEIAGQLSTKKFSNFWNQNDIEFVFSIDQEIASIFIRDKGNINIYRPEQRSEGFQWFLSFFLRLEASAQEKNNIILVDEPGLFLHSKAQKDVLKIFENLSQTNQIIFSTHSPYLIDPKHLNRVRLVTKKNFNTVITNSFHESGADRDTLTPIITAIGLDIQSDLFFSKTNWNIVVEGVSDYYFIRAMIEYLKRRSKDAFPNDITFIPCFGHTSVGLMISFLHALDLKYKILLDKKDTQRTKNKLVRDGITESQFLFAGKEKSDSIESLFSDEDQDNLGLSVDFEQKGIVAREFYEKILKNEIEISKITVDNFTKLLDDIKNQVPNEN